MRRFRVANTGEWCCPKILGLVLVATLALVAPANGAEPITLKVEAVHGLPGLHHSALSRFVAARMAQAGLAEWRFEPAEGDVAARNRVEWDCKLNPYAGGEVRRFVGSPIDERSLHRHRPITIEARLYLNGEYQTLVEKQAIIDDVGGADDPHLAEAVITATQDLLGPAGAYRAIDTGRRHAYPSR